ncbi:MAG: substrate-binding domain-containing protein, partial [Pseudomonadota bacterium]
MPSQSPKPQRTIGVLSPYLGGFYYGDVIRELHRAARAAGIRLLSIRAGRRRPLSIPVALDLVDGWIVWNDSINPIQLSDIVASGKPVVSMAHDFKLPLVTSIQADNRGAIIEATNYLIGQGHRHIFFVGFLNEFDQSERLYGFRSALRQHGLPETPAYEVMVEESGYAGGLNACKALLASGLPFTAVIAATDLIAVGLMNHLIEA